jgi:hypothetical protein
MSKRPDAARPFATPYHFLATMNSYGISPKDRLARAYLRLSPNTKKTRALQEIRAL